ncbi:MAG: hypothetical protein QOG21_329 [Actinomycetota bacterium]|nr:hypothetical protein [Actinomycetota bacterium]
MYPAEAFGRSLLTSTGYNFILSRVIAPTQHAGARIVRALANILRALQKAANRPQFGKEALVQGGPQI